MKKKLLGKIKKKRINKARWIPGEFVIKIIPNKKKEFINNYWKMNE